MKPHKIPLLLLLLIAAYPVSYGWGVFGHTHINKAAVFVLPKTMGQFYFNHLDYIVTESVMPDVRKHENHDRIEALKHFIDLEYFEKDINQIPRTYSQAVKKYSADSISKWGNLPWTIVDMINTLTQAFKQKRKNEILFLSANIAHYIGDAAMPLHTAVNHNGQLTNQQGIHGLWESQLPELFGNNYHYYIDQPHYFENITDSVWNYVSQTHQLVAPLLAADAVLRTHWDTAAYYQKTTNGIIIRSTYGDKMYNKAYSKAYHTQLKGMVEQQLRRAIAFTASCWYTAWCNAGKPDLTSLDSEQLTNANKKNYYAQKKLFSSNKLRFEPTFEYLSF